MTNASRASPRPPSQDEAPTNETPAATQTPVLRSKKLSCPYCGERQSSPSNLWRHKAAECKKNTNPACPFCAWRYKPAELERHLKRCEWKDAPKTTEGTTQETTTHDATERTTKRARIATTAPKTETTTAPRSTATTTEPAAATSTTTAGRTDATEPGSPDVSEPDADDDATSGIHPPPAWAARWKERPSPAMRRNALLSARPRPPPDPPVFRPVDPILGAVAVHAPAWGSVGRAALDVALRGEVAQAEREAREREEEARAAAEHLEKVKKAEQAVRAAKAAGVTFDALDPKALRLKNETPEFRRLMIAASKNMTPEQYADLEQMAARASPEEKAMFGALIQPPPEPEPDEESNPWGVIIGAVVGLGALWLLVEALKPEPPAQAQEQTNEAQAAEAAPKYRPPFDIMRDGTPDDHMARWGHLPVAPKEARADEPERVGFDSAVVWRPPGFQPFPAPAQETPEARKKRREQA